MDADRQFRFLRISVAVVAAVPIAGEPFLGEDSFPVTAKSRAAKAIYRAHPAQQSIKWSPVDAQKLGIAAPRATHAFPLRERHVDTLGRRY